MESMLRMSKGIVAPFMLVSFLMVALFGFVAMSYGPDGRMQGSCLFSATGMAFCPQDALVVARHHISAYQSFFNVPAHSAAMILISALLLAACIVAFAVRSPLFKPPVLTNHFPYSPPVSARTRKITRWLSLLEHSPSFL